MTRIILVLPAIFMSGCIIYDENCKNHNGWNCEVESWEGGLEGGGSGDTAQAPAATFALTPNEAAAGDTFIASLTAENFDLSTVESVEVFGNAGVVATQNRGDELLLTVSVNADAAVGDVVDVLLNVGNDAIFVEAALTVVDPSAGEDADDGSGGTSGGDAEGGGDSGCE